MSAAPERAARRPNPPAPRPRFPRKRSKRPPDLAGDRTAASGGARLLLPVTGPVIRAYEKGKTDGIDIAADAGTPVRAAADGKLAVITYDTDKNPIVVLRHADNLLTVYANIEDVKFEKGQSITRGQTLAVVRDTSPAFLHFEVRRGVDSVDPMDFVN